MDNHTNRENSFNPNKRNRTAGLKMTHKLCVIYMAVSLLFSGLALPLQSVLADEQAFRDNSTRRLTELEYKSTQWEKSLDGKPYRGLKRTREYMEKEIIEYGDTLLKDLGEDEFKGLTLEERDLLQSRVFTGYLIFANKLLKNTKDWCALYKKYRFDEKAPFKNTNDKYWEAADKLFEAQCAEKKKQEEKKPEEKKPEEKKPEDKKPDDKKPGDQAGVFEDCKEGERTIYVCAKEQPMQFELLGDGSNTSTIALMAKNLKTGAWGVALLDTVCASTKNMLPPPPAAIAKAESLTYTLGKGDPKHIALVKTAFRQAAEGKLKRGPLKDPHELAQLTIWQSEGNKTPDTSDDIDRKYFRDKLEKTVGHPFSPEESAAAESRIDKAFEQMNLVNKDSAPEIAEKPDDSKPPKKDGEKPDTPDGSQPPSEDGGQPPKRDADGSTTPSDPDKTSEKAKPQDSAGEPPCTYMCVPPGTTFIPKSPKRQIMLVIRKGRLVMLPGVPSAPNPGANEGPGALIGDEERKPCTWSLEFYVAVTTDKDRAEAQSKLTALKNNEDKSKVEALKEDLAKLRSDGRSVIVFLSFICIDENGKEHRTFKRITDADGIAYVAATRPGEAAKAKAERNRITSKYAKALKPCCDKKL